MNKWLFMVLFCIAASGHSIAQDTNAELTPTPPFVRFPDSAAYAVEVISLQKGESSSAAGTGTGKCLAKVYVTVSAAIRRCVNIWRDGSVTEEWYSGDLKLVKNANGDIYVFNHAFLAGVLGKNDDSIRQWDAADFTWLTRSNYSGIVSFQGRQCYCFEQRNKTESAQTNAPVIYSADSIAGRAGVALIDVQTYLPVAMNDGVRGVVYKFSSSPARDLQLPPKYEAELARIRKQTEAPSRISNKP